MVFTEVSCNGYTQEAKCMVPLTKCMEEDEKERLDKMYEEDLKNLNALLLKNGYETCESLNITVFKIDAKLNADVAVEDNSYDYHSDLNDNRDDASLKSPSNLSIPSNASHHKTHHTSISTILI